MRNVTVILMLLILPVIMKSQTATATIENATACAGDTILVPVNVTDFIDVGAMTIFIGYDTSSAEFIALENLNPVTGGGANVNASDGEVGITYTNIGGFTLTNGKLFDLRYLLTGSSTTLTFNPGTEIANISLEVIALDTINGGITTGLNIEDQPDSVQAYPDTDVTFTVIVSGNNVAYHWEENAGSGWTSLQNNNTYSGVLTETLTVHDVSLSFDGYTYRCLLTSGSCDQYTDTALLEVALSFPVATLGQLTSCPNQMILEPVYVGDFLDVVEFTFNIAYDDSVLEFISLENIHPDLASGSITTSPLGNPPGVAVQWEGTSPVSITSGKLFDLKFEYSNNSTSVAFANGTQVYNSSFNLINITLTNGHVYQHELPIILAQPESQTVRQGEEGIFAVEATGTNSYQWQVSTDGGQNWSDLVNAIPYYNVTTAELTIDPVSWSLNDYQYACLLANAHCELRSAAAVLSVDTLMAVGTGINTISGVPGVSPNPVSSSFTLSFDGKGYSMAEISMCNMGGQLISHVARMNLQSGRNERVIDLSGFPPGVYLCEIRLHGQADMVILRAKVLKSVF